MKRHHRGHYPPHAIKLCQNHVYQSKWRTRIKKLSPRLDVVYDPWFCLFTIVCESKMFPGWWNIVARLHDERRGTRDMNEEDFEELKRCDVRRHARVVDAWDGIIRQQEEEAAKQEREFNEEIDQRLKDEDGRLSREHMQVSTVGLDL